MKPFSEGQNQCLCPHTAPFPIKGSCVSKASLLGVGIVHIQRQKRKSNRVIIDLPSLNLRLFFSPGRDRIEDGVLFKKKRKDGPRVAYKDLISRFLSRLPSSNGASYIAPSSSSSSSFRFTRERRSARRNKQALSVLQRRNLR